MRQDCPGTKHTAAGVDYHHNSFEGLVNKLGSIVLPAPPATYPPAPTAPWIWNNAGIAGFDSGIGAATVPPEGVAAAFLQSSAATGLVGFTFTHTLPGATGRTWRIGFHAAQRHNGGAVDHQRVRVTVTQGAVSEVVFDDLVRDDVYRRHLTRPFVASTATISITFDGTVQETVPQTALVDVVEVREVLPWTSGTTWQNGVVPGTNTPVQIPADACVGVATGSADNIDLMGELLVLESSTQATLSTRLLYVHGDEAWFQVGTEGRPYQGEFELLLDDDQIQSFEWINALLVQDHGTVTMHGRDCTSWLRLSASTDVSPDQEIELEAMPVGWRVNDTIVIASSDRDWQHAERRKIAGIGPGANGVAMVTLDSPLTWVHCGVAQPVQGPLGIVTLDQRAEVGLLTRNVKVRAAPRSTMSVPRLGGHIMITSVHGTLTNPGFGRFTGIELVNLGREKQVGRYPMHWHMLLDGGRGQYMKRCSIRDSNLRVVSVHGTDYVAFEDNVAHEHLGHGVFLEDGSEQWNVFRNNLVLGTKAPIVGKEVLPSDIKPLDVFQNRAPATFWITNPHNTFVGNVAAGGEGCGFWFALPDRHMGDSSQFPADAYFGARTKPYDQALIQFDDNRCHSTWLALDVHDGIRTTGNEIGKIEKNVTWKPRDGQPPSQVRRTETMRRFVAYACNVGIYTGDGDTNIIFDQAMVADCSRALALASHDVIRDSVVVRDSGNNLRAPVHAPYTNANDVTSVLLLYDGAARLQGLHMVGFDGGAGVTSAFNGVGAARRRPGIDMSRVTCSATPLGPLTNPWIAWQDFSAMSDPSYTNGDDATNPNFWAFSISNVDRSLGRLYASVTHPTVVGNHPMLLFRPQSYPAPPEPGDLAYAVPAAVTGGLVRAYSTPFRFAFLRIICTGISGVAPQDPPPLPAPQPTANEGFVLRYSREHHVGATPEVLQYTDRWRTQFFKQMAVAINPAGAATPNEVRYRLLWSDPLWLNVQPPVTEIRCGEMGQDWDSVLLGLEGYALSAHAQPIVERGTAFPDHQDQVAAWQIMTEAADLPTVLQSTQTAWCRDNGVLWLKLVASPPQTPREAITMYNDGRGQAVRIRR